MKLLRVEEKGFVRVWSRLLARQPDSLPGVGTAVANIIARVRKGGDRALIELTKRFDRVLLKPDQLVVSKSELAAAAKKLGVKQRNSLRLAAKRIETFNRYIKEQSWLIPGAGGEILGQLVHPLARVGIYVPGGKACYPSSLLMNAIPARVAGVAELIVCTPPDQQARIDPALAAAARICGVDTVVRVGGAQAIAALAYGTDSIPAVDKIVGPGNLYVTLAKKLVFGQVDIDLLAGPSEILVIADETADIGFVAADLLSQAEHDQMACCLLLTPSERLARAVIQEVAVRLPALASREIARQALQDNGAALVTKSLDQAVELANQLAFEHVELATSHPWDILPKIRNAGAVFLGHYTPEAVGDYMAGPNHTLPTGGTARFSSAVSMLDFIRRTSVIAFSQESLAGLKKDLITLAELEGFPGHAQAVRERFKL